MNSARATSSKRVNVLTLDGGGVRGISTLLILQELMRLINESIHIKYVEHKILEPHEVFELVAGTSTGGLIAIMLGKLGMSVEECINAYRNMSTRIFGKKHLRARLTGGLAPARYSGLGLEGCVRQLMRERDIDENLAMHEGEPTDRIACAVLCREHRSRSRYADFKPEVVCICSLPCHIQLSCLVYEAARATSAAPTFFPVREINGRYFADGGMEFNNPSHEIFDHYSRPIRVTESRRTSVASEFAISSEVHGSLDFSEVRFINLGTGTEPKIEKIREQSKYTVLLPGAIRMGLFLKRNLTKMATNSERVADAMRTIARVSSGGSLCTTFHRFSADNGVCFIKMDRYKKLPEIEHLTRAYLESVAVQRRLRQVAKEIAEDYLEKQSFRVREPATDRLVVPGQGSVRPRTPESGSTSRSGQTSLIAESIRQSLDHDNTPSKDSTNTVPSSIDDQTPTKQQRSSPDLMGATHPLQQAIAKPLRMSMTPAVMMNGPLVSA